ncbi:MAG: hypothetical protein ACRBHB_09605 [Arenicella sp.]
MTIFNPLNDSLAERIRAYRSVQKAYVNIEASLKFADDPEWIDTLGETQDIEEAHKIIVDSLQEATQAITVEDIDKAKEQGLMSEDEAYEFVKEKLDQQRGVNKSLSQKGKQSHGLKI